MIPLTFIYVFLKEEWFTSHTAKNGNAMATAQYLNSGAGDFHLYFLIDWRGRPVPPNLSIS